MVKTSNIVKLLLTVACLTMSPLAVEGAPFKMTWSATVLSFGVDPPGVSNGDPFDFTFVVDNGGSSLLSQTWSAADFVSATINVNNGVYIGAKSFLGGTTTGSFQTDGAGNLTSVPTAWNDYFTGNPYSDSLGNNEGNSGLGGYFINGNNEVWAISTPATPGGVDIISISALNVVENQSPSSWTASAVPEPSTIVLAGFGLFGMILAARRRLG